LQNDSRASVAVFVDVTAPVPSRVVVVVVHCEPVHVVLLDVLPVVDPVPSFVSEVPLVVVDPQATQTGAPLTDPGHWPTGQDCGADAPADGATGNWLHVPVPAVNGPKHTELVTPPLTREPQNVEVTTQPPKHRSKVPTGAVVLSTVCPRAFIPDTMAAQAASAATHVVPPGPGTKPASQVQTLFASVLLGGHVPEAIVPAELNCVLLPYCPQFDMFGLNDVALRICHPPFHTHDGLPAAIAAVLHCAAYDPPAVADAEPLSSQDPPGQPHEGAPESAPHTRAGEVSLPRDTTPSAQA